MTKIIAATSFNIAFTYRKSNGFDHSNRVSVLCPSLVEVFSTNIKQYYIKIGLKSSIHFRTFRHLALSGSDVQQELPLRLHLEASDRKNFL